MSASLEDHIQVFLEENGRASSMDIKEEMTGLGYSKYVVPEALRNLKKKGKVKQLEDNNGNPVNKYEAITDV